MEMLPIQLKSVNQEIPPLPTNLFVLEEASAWSLHSSATGPWKLLWLKSIDCSREPQRAGVKAWQFCLQFVSLLCFGPESCPLLFPFQRSRQKRSHCPRLAVALYSRKSRTSEEGQLPTLHQPHCHLHTQLPRRARLHPGTGESIM